MEMKKRQLIVATHVVGMREHEAAANLRCLEQELHQHPNFRTVKATIETLVARNCTFSINFNIEENYKETNLPSVKRGYGLCNVKRGSKHICEKKGCKIAETLLSDKSPSYKKW